MRMNRRELTKNIQRVKLTDYYNEFDVRVERKKRFKNDTQLEWLGGWWYN